jgi:hypothetical protein
MTKKPTGLAAFTGGAGAAAPAEQAPAVAARTGGRKRAQGDTVALTVRVKRSDWARLRQLADAEGASLQSLAIDGLSKVMADHGLPPLDPTQ